MTNDLKQLINNHDDVMDKILVLLMDHDVSPSDGEAILLYLAGASAGLRQQPLIGEDWLKWAALGWEEAVKLAD